MGRDLAASARRLNDLRAEAEAVGADDFAVAGILSGQLIATAYQGRLGVALEGFRAAVKWCEEGGKYRVNRGFRFQVAYMLYALDRMDEALEAFQAADEEGHRLGFTYLISMNDAVRAAALFSIGRLEDAAAAADSARQLAEDFGFDGNLAECLRVLGEVSLAQGNFAVASRCAEQIGPLLKEGNAPITASWLPAILADARSDPGWALVLLEPALERLGRGDYWLVLTHAERLPVLAGICLRAGRANQATMVATQAASFAAINGAVPLLRGVALHCHGLVDGDEGVLAEAVSSLRCCNRPLALAAALEELGGLRLQRGDLAGGTEALSEAYEVSGSCGAERAAARIRQTLRGVGVVKRARAAVARPTSGWESLTGAEMTVVKLVAAGHSSRGVAEQLYVSLNTVNTHLRHIFTKLGLRSRVELTRTFLEMNSAASHEFRPAHPRDPLG